MSDLYRAMVALVASLRRKVTRARWHRRFRRFEETIERYSAETNDFFVVQIGACDGVVADPIHQWIRKYHWHGILVEPQKNEFERLRAIYSDNPNLRFENVAITDSEGMRPLYRVKPDRVDADWQRGVASLVTKPSHVAEDMIGVEMVPCITFATLFNRHPVERIDLLQIDVEGYDYELLKAFDFGRMRPRLIRYEHFHLRSADRRACINYLKRRGYDVLEMQYDTGAVLRRR